MEPAEMGRREGDVGGVRGAEFAAAWTPGDAGSFVIGRSASTTVARSGARRT
jgi:hypothetical protein